MFRDIRTRMDLSYHRDIHWCRDYRYAGQRRPLRRAWRAKAEVLLLRAAMPQAVHAVYVSALLRLSLLSIRLRYLLLAIHARWSGEDHSRRCDQMLWAC